MTGKELQQLRKKAKLTQEQLAKMMGVKYQTISNYERGSSIPPDKRVYVEDFYQNLEIHKNESNHLAEDRVEYQKSDKNEILSDILYEIKEVRKENNALKSKVDKMELNRSEEMKMNDLLRKQLQLAINVLKSLDVELEKHKLSAGAEDHIGKAY